MNSKYFFLIYLLFVKIILHAMKTNMWEFFFNDKRITTLFIGIWSLICVAVFTSIMYADNSPFLNFGPSSKTELFGVKLDSWTTWWAVALYTFFSTAIAAFSSDSVVPWITNTIQDHKTEYIPYSKTTCLIIIQTFTFYAVTQSVIGLFVALTQVDFMLIRLLADWIVNHYTTFWFLKHKQVNVEKYEYWNQFQKNIHELQDDDELLGEHTELADLSIETSTPVPEKPSKS